MKGEQRAESYYPPRSLHSFHLLFVDLHSLEMPGHALTLAISYSSFIVTSSYQTLRIQDQQRCYSPMGEPSEVHLMFPSLKTDCLASGTMPDYLKSVQCSQWNFFFVLASPLFLFERLMPIWSEFFNQGNLVSGSCWPSPPHSPLHTPHFGSSLPCNAHPQPHSRTSSTGLLSLKIPGKDCWPVFTYTFPGRGHRSSEWFPSEVTNVIISKNLRL